MFYVGKSKMKLQSSQWSWIVVPIENMDGFFPTTFRLYQLKPKHPNFQLNKNLQLGNFFLSNFIWANLAIENTLVCLKWELTCVTNFGGSPYFLDKTCLVKTQKSPFLSNKMSPYFKQTNVILSLIAFGYNLRL